jgi:cobalt-zinc-cadmium efflux system protein
MGYDHHGHGHEGGDGHGSSSRRLALVLALTATYTVVEAVGGVLTGSLALLADAGHMLSDVAALALALFAGWLAGHSTTPERTFGFKRAEVLAALANGVALVAISIWILVEAYRRISEPPEILGGGMLAVAVVGLLVNVGGAAILFSGRRENLNIAAAFRHVMADVLGSIGAIVAAVVILLTGWRYADPLVSVAIAVLVLASSWSILREAVRILLEAAPPGVDADTVGRAMAERDGIVEVHDLHIWTISSGFPALAAHVMVSPGDDCHARRRELELLLHDSFGIEHTTLQVDHETDSAALLQIRGTPAEPVPRLDD